MRSKMVHWNKEIYHGVKIKHTPKIKGRENRKEMEQHFNIYPSPPTLTNYTQPACLQVPQGWLPTDRLPMADLLPRPADEADPWAYLPWT